MKKPERAPTATSMAAKGAAKGATKGPAIRTSTTRAWLSRRAFLRGAGASLALLPMLESERAQGATAAGPKRLVTIAWSNGVAQPNFYPPGTDPTASVIMTPLAALKNMESAWEQLPASLKSSTKFSG